MDASPIVGLNMSKIVDYDKIGQVLHAQRIVTEAFKLRSHKSYQPWRMACLKRDRYRCKCCQSKENLHVHHIYEWQRYPLVRFDKANGITLCASCHRKVHDYYKKPPIKKPTLFLVRNKQISVKPLEPELPDVILTIKTFMGNNNTVSNPEERILKKRRKWFKHMESVKHRKKMKWLRVRGR